MTLENINRIKREVVTLDMYIHLSHFNGLYGCQEKNLFYKLQYVIFELLSSYDVNMIVKHLNVSTMIKEKPNLTSFLSVLKDESLDEKVQLALNHFCLNFLPGDNYYPNRFTETCKKLFSTINNPREIYLNTPHIFLYYFLKAEQIITLYNKEFSKDNSFIDNFCDAHVNLLKQAGANDIYTSIKYPLSKETMSRYILSLPIDLLNIIHDYTFLDIFHETDFKLVLQNVIQLNF